MDISKFFSKLKSTEFESSEEKSKTCRHDKLAEQSTSSDALTRIVSHFDDSADGSGQVHDAAPAENIPVDASVKGNPVTASAESSAVVDTRAVISEMDISNYFFKRKSQELESSDEEKEKTCRHDKLAEQSTSSDALTRIVSSGFEDSAGGSSHVHDAPPPTENIPVEASVIGDPVISFAEISAVVDEPAAISGVEVYVNDIGLHINSSTKLTADRKHDLLLNPYVPPNTYNFKNDSSGSRSFRSEWLQTFSPWLVYSPYLSGPICKYCTLFPQHVSRGTQGAFIISPFTRYNDLHESARKHTLCNWHRNAQEDASNFLYMRQNPEKTIVCRVDASVRRQVEENRKKLLPILSTIIFCGTHDIALRGKKSTTGNVKSLYDFRIESGDEVLKDHLENAPANARYTSVRVENELINLCEETIREDIISLVNSSSGFSLIADESADISGTEQLSIGVRFVDTCSAHAVIKEEFLGFAPLTQLDASSVSDTIIDACKTFGLNLEKLHGQGYDGCSTMAGKEGGVQAKIKRKYPKAVFVHCAAHKLNLVVNDLNAVPEVRNSVGTVKAIIKFFCESPKRRALIPNVPLLSETRWTSKYKSIRMFSTHFKTIFEKLTSLATAALGKTRQDAYQLQSSSCTTSFLICLKIISTYSARLESVTQALQAVELDILKVCDHVQELLVLFHDHRAKADEYFGDIFSEVKELATNLDVELSVPRQCGRQTYRSNSGTLSVEEYYRQSIFIPYLESLISSLESRFNNESRKFFSLFSLHPLQMSKMTREEYRLYVSNINEVYKIDNLEAESLTWFESWSKKLGEPCTFDNGLLDLLKHTDLYPSIKEAILIALTLPVTTCTVERSFSTMRRVKTWLRSTMSNDRLSGLCMMSIHRAQIDGNKSQLIEKVINKFGSDPRRLQLLFEAS